MKVGCALSVPPVHLTGYTTSFAILSSSIAVGLCENQSWKRLSYHQGGQTHKWMPADGWMMTLWPLGLGERWVPLWDAVEGTSSPAL